MLTPHQTDAFNRIINFIKGGEKRVLLKGSAGTGKTFLVKELADFIVRDWSINPNYNNGEVYVTAPTNKALSILQGKITSKVEFKTIHSALKMKMYTDAKSGQRKFIKPKSSYNNKNPFEHAKACFVDECSMLNSEFIGGNEKVTVPYLQDYTFPIIFTGDSAQLNPVLEEFSPVFHQGYPEVELTEIIRQGKGNPIIELSRDIDLIYFKKPKVIEGKGYVYSNNKQSLIDNLAEVNGTDDLKYLAYTNNDIDSMNQLVRERRYGNPKRIEKDETIVFNSPYGNFFTNKEVKVESVEVIIDDISVPKEKTRYENGLPITDIDSIKIKYYRINDAINVIHEHSDDVFKAISTTLKENCNRHGWNWNGYFFFVEQFADIKYNHAITIHKSQGSTYKESILNIGNIAFNKNAAEKQRLLYTGITRASNLVILNNVK